MTNTLKHIAIIMDGNGRWAKQQGQKRTFGHQQGIESVRSVVEGACENNIQFLTLYAFSTENWNRPKEEVDMLMNLLAQAIANEVDMLQKNNIRLLTIGRIQNLPQECQKALSKAIDDTAKNTGLTLTLALSYSGRAEIVDTMKKIANSVLNKNINIDDISDKTISENLYNPQLPDVDLLIRTGGDMRISNFLLWQISYAELFFTDLMWPEFGKNHLKEIIDIFLKRERRFGKTSEQVQ